MMDIMDFLAARIYEDENDARDALELDEERGGRMTTEAEVKKGILLDHMTRRRRWLALGGPASGRNSPDIMALRYISLPYSRHPDYQEIWFPPIPGSVEVWGRR